MGWRVSPRDHAFFLWSPTNERFTPTWDELPDFTIPKLIKREDVMERVASFINQATKPTQLRRSYANSGKYANYADETDDGVPAYEDDFLLEWAITLGITPEQLMGVEG